MDNKTALLSVKEMSRADALTINAGVPEPELMNNAGTAVANVIMARWPEQPVVVLCGPGKNGGDGYVVAQKLNASGWRARAVAFDALCATALGDATLVVDAIFGAGLSRKVDGQAKLTLNAAANKKLIIVAVDVPSGITGDSGEDLGAIQANLTVTFFRKKPGHLLFPGRKLCGETIVCDIGISSIVLTTIAPTTFENHPSLWQSAIPSTNDNDHKYKRGHALIYGGYPMTGAARLAAHAAARMGAGLTTIAVPEHALSIYTAGLMSIMIKPLQAPDSMELLLADTRFSGFLIGPGAGLSEESKTNTLQMLATKKPLVIDADAITSFKEQPSLLFQSIAGPCVLTPHEGEFDRIFAIKGDKLQRARAAAKQSGAIVILKGADTVIASPDGRAVINSNAPATLATAGSGDVLSGMILGLLSQGMDPFLACCAAVWMHGAAAKLFGIGLIADDLPDLLPKVRSEFDAISLT
jgi:ADP-dependent NAD(P)H-hydrate dehydratase / NAD(P)H-hydrate epimerase